jgi:indole-3-glycerol phosphate synthase
MPADTLTRIAAHVQKRLEKHQRENPVDALKKKPLYARAPRDFAKAFEGTGPRVIAEVKFASPSEGFLRESPTKEDAVSVAGGYLSNGAAALSVLTERNFFAGDFEYLSAIREANPGAFLLMKDFTLGAYQLHLARSLGADCVLLIAALLGSKLPELLEEAKSLGLSALVEVHDEAELSAARAARARIVGVNSRDLRTLKTDLGVARRLAPLAKGMLLIAESGLKTREDLDELGALGYRGFLIGTSLMKEPDPGAALKRLLA